MRSQQVPFRFFGHEPITLDSFLGEANVLAVQLVCKLARGDTAGSIYLWGRRGCGKTHLLHAACNEADACERRAVYIDCAECANLAPAVLDGLEQFDLVCLDGLHEIAGLRDWERAVMRLFEDLRQRRSGLLLASQKSLAALPGMLPDLRTRLGWDLVCRLRTLTDEEKIVALRRRATLRAMELPEEVADYLLHHVSRDPCYLFNLLERLDAASLAEQRRLTLPFVRQVLGPDAPGAPDVSPPS